MRLSSAILLLAVCQTLEKTAEGAAAKNWTLLWGDEFEGNALDRTQWNYELGWGCQYLSSGWPMCGFGNDELVSGSCVCGWAAVLRAAVAAAAAQPWHLGPLLSAPLVAAVAAGWLACTDMRYIPTLLRPEILQQYYGFNNIQVHGGSLHIVARLERDGRTMTSGRIYTSYAVMPDEQYKTIRVSARVKLDRGKRSARLPPAHACA